MSGVDDSVVQLTFDNSGFESKIGNTLQALDHLSNSLKFQSAQDGFKNVSAAADSVNLSSMSGALDNISSKFSAMGAIGFSVINNLTTGALTFAKTVGEKVLDPLLTGGKQRAINLDNAKFAFQGLGIDVTAAMDSALSAVKGTAFGLDEAAKAAAQFGASGIGAGADMTQSLRGIAGIAAMTNRSFGEIADIMTSSAATGKVTNQDLLQFATRGLNASAAYAKATGITEAKVHEMATAGTLDYASFAKAMDETFGAHAQEADKTFTGAMGNMHAALSRLGAAFYIPQIENTRKLLNAFSPVVDGLKTALTPVVDTLFKFEQVKTDKVVAFLGALDFTKLKEPMQNFADALDGIMKAIQAFITPIKEAFKEVFPIDAIGTLTKISDMFQNFTGSLKIGGETAEKVKSIFSGIFSVFDIVWHVAKELLFVISDLVGEFSGAGSGVLDFSAGLGDALTRLDNFLVKGGALHEFFLKLRADIQAPIQFLQGLGSAVVAMFQSFSASDAADTALGRVNSRIDETEHGVARIKEIWQGFTDRFSAIFDVLNKVWDFISNWFSTLGQKIAAAFHPGDFDSAVDIVNVGFLGAIALMFKKFMQGGVDNLFSSGVVSKVKAMLSGVTTTLKAMQTDLKADALVKIASALAILAVSLVALSLIDSAALTKALTAMAVSFGELVGVMTLIDKLVDSNTAAIKLGIIGAALIEFSIAAGILTLAIRNLSGLSWDELVKGLVGVAGGLVIMVMAAKLMDEGSVGMIAAGAGMTAISVGLLVLSEAVKSFASMSWGEIVKGLTGVAGGLILVTVAMNLMPPSSAISGLGFIEVSAGLIILAQAVKQFGNMDWGVMGKGLLGIGGALIIVAAAMNLMPLDAPITAAGLLILSAALMVMAEAVKVLGNLDMGTLAKGIGALAAMMLILTLAMNAMDGALPGAAALVIVSAALMVLENVMEKLGAMKAGDIVKSLIALAGVFAVLGIAALVMEPIIPALLGLGVALTLIGGGFTLFGAGVWLVAKGLEALAATGVAGAKAFVEIMKTASSAIPEVLGTLIESIVQQGEELLKAMPLLVRLITAVLDQLLDTVIQLAPKLGKALVAVIKSALLLMREEFPDYVKTGLEMLLAILQGIRDNTAQIVTVVADIVVNFLNAFRKKVPELVDASYNLFVTVLTSIARKLGQATFLFVPIAVAFMDGFLTGLKDAVGELLDFFEKLPGRLLDIIKTGLGIESPSTFFMDVGTNIILGLLNGLVAGVDAIFNFFVELPGQILGWIGDVAVFELKGVEVVANLLLGIVTKAADLEAWWLGLAVKVLEWVGDVTLTLLSKGIDLVTGLLNGIIQAAVDLTKWWLGLPGMIIGWLGDLAFLEIRGIQIVAGFLLGIVNKAVDLEKWWLGLGGKVLEWIGDIAGKLAQKGIDLITGFLSGAQGASLDIWHWLESLPAWFVSALGDTLGWLHDAAVNVIVGFWQGLESMKDWLFNKIGDLAGSAIDAFKGVFGFGSPSRVFRGFGVWIVQGLVNGLTSMSKSVSDVTDALSQSVVDGFDVDKINNIFNEIVSHLDGMDEFKPTISPVLDLTNVKMGAKDLTDLFNGTTIAPVVSSAQAGAISTTAELAKSVADSKPPPPTEVTFNQYNNSPDALSTNDIYRNTKSQIALAKEELSI